ncbi:hypothetical protein FOA52_011364 [Chlamydomonas sp. UWO 241]|nr:hypothetical protein FOA52_011364 [Chlamydomonas sp. UWO 241]
MPPAKAPASAASAKPAAAAPSAKPAAAAPAATAPAAIPPVKPAAAMPPAAAPSTAPATAPSKKAVLIGCNYPGTSAELMGCINDVHSIYDLLTTCCGFVKEDITVMIDEGSGMQPTGKNIKDALRAMVKAAKDGDELVVHFSGHGTQVPSDDPEEKDAKDEAICPCDMNIIEDDDLREIFKPLHDKGTVKLTLIADCCHSGTLLDHAEIIIDGPKPGGPPPPSFDIAALQGMLASLSGGKEMPAGGPPMKNRALPFNDLCGMLTKMMAQMGGASAGKTATQGNISSSLTSLFGADANKKAIGMADYMGAGKAAFALYQAATSGKTDKASQDKNVGILMSFMQNLCGSGAPPTAGETATSGATPNAAFSGSPAAAAASDGNAPAKPPPAGFKPPQHDRLSDDIGILITGCQDKETSADARPAGGKPHGALTNAIVTVAKQHYATDPGYPLTYRNLVIGVRDMLGKTGFSQNPCLECGQKWADAAFVVTDK